MDYQGRLCDFVLLNAEREETETEKKKKKKRDFDHIIDQFAPVKTRKV